MYQKIISFVGVFLMVVSVGCSPVSQAKPEVATIASLPATMVCDSAGIIMDATFVLPPEGVEQRYDWLTPQETTIISVTKGLSVLLWKPGSVAVYSGNGISGFFSKEKGSGWKSACVVPLAREEDVREKVNALAFS